MNYKIKKLTQTAIFAALCFVTFTYMQIKIPTPSGDFTSIHFGNIFLVLAALLLGPTYGGLAGAIGMTLADLIDPAYIIVAPKTFILKFIIGIIVGNIAVKKAKINDHSNKKYYIKWALISSIVGMAFNVIADPSLGYVYKLYILGQPAKAASVLAKISAGITLFNAFITVIFANIIYLGARPILKKNNLI